MFAAMGCLAWALPATAQASSPPSVFDESVSHITEHDATLEATINPNGLKTTYQFRLESGCLPPLACLAIATYPLPSGEIAASTGAHPVSLDLNSAGVTLRPDTEYRYSIEATSSAGTNESPGHLFTTAPASAPSIQGESVSNITPTDATLQAQINPEGHSVRYQLQVVSNPDEYRSEIVCPPHLGPPFVCIGEQVAEALPIGFLEGGSTDQSVSLDLATAGMTLKPGTTYHYRVIAARSVQTEDTIAWESPPVYGPDHTFTTPPPPVIDSVSLSHLTSSDATLEAQINTEGLETRYQFRLSSICGGRGACLVVINYPLPTNGVLLGSFVGQSVSLDLNSAGVTLQPGGNYTYSISATNASGTTEGAPHNFTTHENVVQPLSTTTSPLSGAGQSPGSDTNSGDQPTRSGGSPAPGVTPLGSQIVCLCNCARGCHGKKVSLTRTQNLSKVLKACDKKPKKQRPSCRHQAEKKYSATSKHRA